MNIFLTGGCGYIGSHTALQLLQEGHRITLFDNLSNSDPGVVSRLRQLSSKAIEFFEGDIRDTDALYRALSNTQADAVIHFAGVKDVFASVLDPVACYSNNVEGTISLIDSMKRSGAKNLVFSSSATVYGDPQSLPIPEEHQTAPMSPYGWSKLHIEQMLADAAKAYDWSVAILRYFNPVGCHESGFIGESPTQTPSNLLPYMIQVAMGHQSHLQIWGDDYNTPDGTGVRDFIHVMDLADGHIAACNHLLKNNGFDVFNLGTGKGCSVLEFVSAFEKLSGVTLKKEIGPRRSGDIATSIADPSKANKVLKWSAKKTLDDVCRSAWHFASRN